MMSPCETVAERLALGEPLGELAAHANDCPRCSQLSTLTSQLGATRSAIDPGLGFSSRMTVGAQHRLAVRTRRRVAVGLATTVAAAAIGVFAFTRAPAPEHEQSAATATQPAQKSDPAPSPSVDVAHDDDLKALVNLADLERSSHLSARWGHIKKPLRPYRKLLEGITP